MGAWISQRWYAIVPAFTAVILGLWGIGTPGPWLDEMFTIEAVTDGLGSHLWDAPMLPYYAVMWLWSGGGTVIDIGWLRLPSVLAFSTAAAIVAVTARRLATVRAGLAAGMVLALAPGLARYAHEARTYAMALALVSAATLALLRAADSDRTRSWALYSTLMGTATLVLPVSLAVLPAHAVILGGIQSRRPWRRWAASLYVLLPVLALEAGFAILFDQTRGWLEVPTFTSLLNAYALVVASEYTSAAYGLAVVAIGLASPTGRRWLLGLLSSVLVVWIVSVTVSNWWLARAFVPLAGIACVAAGLAVARVSWGWIAGMLALLAVLGASDQLAIRQPFSRGMDPEVIAEVIDREGTSGDAIVSAAQPSYLSWSMSHYLAGDPRFTVPSASRPAAGRYWIIGDRAPCQGARGWMVAPESTLWLCEVTSGLDELDGGP